MAYKNGFKTVCFPISGTGEDVLVYIDARDISLYDKERSEYIDFYHQEKLTGLAFENEIYYKFEDLKILEQYKFIEKLWIEQKNIKDLSGIKYVNHLKYLAIDSINTAIFDFEIIKDSLEVLFLTWHKKLSNLHLLKRLRVLHLEKDTDEILLPPNIEDLAIWKSKRTKLDFLENHQSLNRIEFYANRKLENIEGLQHLSSSLEKLELEGCKKIADYTPILKLKKLKYLRISSYDKAKKEELRKLQPLLRKQIDEVIIYPLLK